MYTCEVDAIDALLAALRARGYERIGPTVRDGAVTDLTVDHAERWRQWDSCFSLDFSYIHGGSVRSSISSRYRQWLTHTMASWQDQFDTLGCVGCGRCITWCPAGIDLTDEVRGIRAEDTRRNREHIDG